MGFEDITQAASGEVHHRLKHIVWARGVGLTGHQEIDLLAVACEEVELVVEVETIGTLPQQKHGISQKIWNGNMTTVALSSTLNARERLTLP